MAISTSRGEGGLGIVRLSGPGAIQIGRRVFRCTPPLGERIRHVEYGRVVDGNREIDTGLAWALKAPNSYTGEDTIEISCHGSCLVLDTLVQVAVANGAVPASPGEFTRRAFLNGHLDLLQAEAVVDLIQAGNKFDLENAYGHSRGRLSNLVRQLKSRLIRSLSLLEVGLDFSDEDVDEVCRQQILDEIHQAIESGRQLSDTFEGSRRRQDGLLIVLAGRPNVGKSTLLNALLGEEKAIVTPVPGTTRDLVEGRTTWAGETVRVLDTAGLRAGRGLVEKEGIRRTRESIANADLVLAILDASRDWQEEDEQAMKLALSRPCLAVLNKFDLPRRLEVPAPWRKKCSCLNVSALRETGLNLLRKRAMEMIPRPNLVEGVGITRQRHRDCLMRAVERAEKARETLAGRHLDECAAAEIREAVEFLGEMLGEKDPGEDVLDKIFSEFCIGK